MQAAGELKYKILFWRQRFDAHFQRPKNSKKLKSSLTQYIPHSAFDNYYFMFEVKITIF